MFHFFLLVTLVTLAMTPIESKPDVSSATVSPDFLDLHYLPQQSCKCSEPEQCPSVYVSLKRERANVVNGKGSRSQVIKVDLIREQIQEIPSHSVVYSESEVIEIQKIPEPLFMNVTLEREVYEEEIDYYEVVIQKFEINYIYRDVHVYPEVEEPVAVPNVRQEKLPVFVTHRPVHFNETTFEVVLKHEYLVSHKGDALDVEEKMEFLEERIEKKESTIQCESLRYVPVPCYPPGQKPPRT